MSQPAKEITNVYIEDELKRSYLDYAMSVIVSRALPDVRDGLKPVHRRVLFAMRELGNEYNKPYKKSARIVGDVIGKYHPHGDSAVYDTIVRMAQPFSLRYPLVDGQGNFGSIDGDSPAAMRYTEIRLTKMAHYLLMDLDKETVNFVPNYDDTEFAPEVLPTRLPNLLINGSSGIAVGMATNIPPHNLGEVVDACLALISNPEIELCDLIKIIPGPDFPTAGIINGRAGIESAYRTGRGKIRVRSKVSFENVDETGHKQAIVIDELPYQVNKASLIIRIAELVKEKKIEGITAVRDESDKDGMRVVIELRRGEVADVVLNNLFINTNMQVTFGINIVALDNGQPKTLNLKQLLEAFLKHRREVIVKRCIFELKQARNRAHILEGLSIALANIDEMIALIKNSKNSAAAKQALLAKTWKPGFVKTMLEQLENASTSEFGSDSSLNADGDYVLSETQAQAILDLRLHRLTGLEQEKIFNEYKELLAVIKNLLDILASPDLLLEVIRKELLEVRELFTDKRRTEIIEAQEDLTHEDLITPEDVVVTLSHEGYAKIQAISEYHAQKRGGKGKVATKVKEEDFVAKLFIANTHDTLLCFSNKGKLYWLKVYLLPQESRTSRGRPLVNLLPLEKDERINAVLPIREYLPNHYLFMVTAKGVVKKVELELFSHPRSNGIIAVDLQEDDNLVSVALTDGSKEIMLFSDAGKAVRFSEEQVRPMGRSARGVRGMSLKDDQKVISLIIPEENHTILMAAENGYGKRTEFAEFPIVNRGAQGVIAIKISDRNGKAVCVTQVFSSDGLMLISDQGTLIRIRANAVSIIGRNTQGVKLINLKDDEKLIDLRSIEDAMPVITIDGPGGSGKGIISKLLAEKLGWNLLDSGLIYRFLAFTIIKNKIPFENLAEILEAIKLLNITDMNSVDLRSEEFGNVASELAVIPEVRAGINLFLYDFKQLPGLVADGRDMGTVVFPDAGLKIFLTASVEERAKRRFLQLQQTQQLQGGSINATLETVLESLIERDARDASRLVAPLKPDPTAVIVDTTKLSIDETLQLIYNLIRTTWSTKNFRE